MTIVADTNVFLAIALGAPERARISQLTTGCSLAAPQVRPFILGNATTAMRRKGVLRTDEVAYV